jgi:polyvinyl alcohol dehydrogenase (cytochrome)
VHTGRVDFRPPAAATAIAALALAACTAGVPGRQHTGHPASPASHTAAASSPGVTAPSGTSSGPGRSAAAGPATQWTTYHHNLARTGTVGGLPRAGRLKVDWSRHLDGAVYGQPLVIGNLVIAATEDDSVYGLNRVTGRISWMRHLGRPLPLSDQPCGDIDPLGITSTPVLYRGLVYVVTQDGRTRHVLFGLDPANGRVRYERAVPSPDGRPYYDQQRASLTAEDGRVYVTFGGHAGDCGPYDGSVVGMPAAGQRERIVHYLVPTSNQAGIWAPGGPAIDHDGTLFVGVGNGATHGRFDDSDSVTALTPGLHRIGVFAPVTWLADNRADLDLGSMTPALTRAGQILMDGKRGTAYLLNPRHLGGVGGQLAQLAVCPAFGGAAVLKSVVIIPCAAGGLAAVSVPPGKLRVLWRGPRAAAGSPVAGGGAVWVTNYDAGVLYELNPRTGHVEHSIRLGTALPHFESPSLSGRLVLVGTLHGVIAVSGA